MGLVSVFTRVRGPVFVLTVDDGHANVLDVEVVQQMLRAMATAQDEAQALVIAGRPGWFSTGLDQQVFEAGGEAASALLHGATELILRSVEFPRPVVAACTGTALGAGAVGLMASDYRVGAAGDYEIGIDYVSAGSPVPDLAVELARTRLSPRHLTLACNTAQMYSPQQAIEVGFLDTVTAEDPVEVAVEAAARLAERVDPQAFAETRAITCRGLADSIIRSAGALWRLQRDT